MEQLLLARILWRGNSPIMANQEEGVLISNLSTVNLAFTFPWSHRCTVVPEA